MKPALKIVQLATARMDNATKQHGGQTMWSQRILRSLFIISTAFVFTAGCEEGGEESFIDGEEDARASGSVKMPYEEGFGSQGGRFKCKKATCEWNSREIITKGATAITISADVKNYTLGQFESADFLRFSYKIDGGSWTKFFEQTADLKTKKVTKLISKPGGTLRIRIQAKTSASNETYEVDNLKVTGNQVDTDTGIDTDTGDTDDGDTTNSACKVINGCYEIKPSGGSDDSGLIQTTLNGLKSGNTIKLTGNFVIGHTVYLPSNINWILNGRMTLGTNNKFDKVVVVYNGVTNSKLTAITDNKNGATNISMIGGTYDGKYTKDPGGNPIRYLNFAKVTYSKFHNMIIENSSDDNFTLHAYSKYNEVRNMIGRKSLANGLNDKGEYNKWYDSIAEDCESDGWTPKCRNSEFHRCIARNNKGPGFGLYARIDGDITKGAVISGNKFFDCEAYNNLRAGMSFNIADGRGPGAIIKDNYVQGKFYNNGMYGVAFRNKEPDGVVSNNVVDILAFGNKGEDPKSGAKLSSGPGLKLDGLYISGTKGVIVSYDNYSLDMDLNDATNCSIVVYNPVDENPAELKTGSSTNNVSEKTFSCQGNLTTWSTKEYCGK